MLNHRNKLHRVRISSRVNRRNKIQNKTNEISSYGCLNEAMKKLLSKPFLCRWRRSILKPGKPVWYMGIRCLDSVTKFRFLASRIFSKLHCVAIQIQIFLKMEKSSCQNWMKKKKKKKKFSCFRPLIESEDDGIY